VLLDFEFCSHNYRWIDLLRIGNFASGQKGHAIGSIDLKSEPLIKGDGASWRPFWARDWSLRCPYGLFAVAGKVDIKSAIQRLGIALEIAVDIEVHVSDGAVGIGLLDSRGSYLPAAEVIVEASRDTKLVTLRADNYRSPVSLVFRNLRAHERSAILVKSAVLRQVR